MNFVGESAARLFRIRPLGDRALVVYLDTEMHEGERWLLAAGMAELLREAGLTWLVDVVPAYDTVTVVYARFDYEQAAADVERILLDTRHPHAVEPRLIEIPVCYGGHYGPDLAACASRAGMTEASFVTCHAAAEYQVAMIGFMPGFPYLSGLPAELRQPRLARPRSSVPAGAVGIAGGQTGIYPLSTPGGWQLIGLTPLRLFDPKRAEPFLLRMGDKLRFVPISEQDLKEQGEAP
ncbi:5-oxoprolinase subunit PxpB [Paenibacillus sp. BC26]|uniref:5-oxoprolinase subunit PxpB n=1 Tax=Paenibacillus sp. BC26 TaxID=1881032 RepID=UPI0008EFA268|nr:5-oxoprolinase subunit PxpB [Paenibacillus sp. BC26]SFS49459.1 sensor histidine kinase inhibitor, KipI family [Paenibacillus sp. BC26]